MYKDEMNVSRNLVFLTCYKFLDRYFIIRSLKNTRQKQDEEEAMRPPISCHARIQKLPGQYNAALPLRGSHLIDQLPPNSL
jgi:hypothetical protein